MLLHVYAIKPFFLNISVLRLRNPNTLELAVKMSSSQSSSWQQSKAKSQSWFQKIGDSVNKASTKLGAEAFWPTSLDKESDKAAKILRSFCIDGFTTDQHKKEKNKALDRIPAEAC